MLTAFLAAATMVGVLAGSAAGVTRHVPSEYPTIQAGLDASGPGDVVLVAPGTYTDVETRDLSGSNWTSCVFLVDAVTLRTEAGPEVTIIDMQHAPGPQPDVILSISPGDYTVEGFTITGVGPGGHGAFVIGNVTFRDCVFRDIDIGGSAGAGIVANANLVLERCEFVNCVAGSGGAIYHANGTIAMYDCVFRACGNNAVLLAGNGVPPQESSHIEGCTFQNCYSGTSAASAALSIQQHHGGSVVKNCRFFGNVGAATTGAMGITGFSPTPKVVENCLFWSNSAPEGTGGGLRVSGPTNVRANTFYENSCAGTVGGAAISFSSSASGEFRNNLIVNSVNPGGAIYAEGVFLVSACNVFWENSPGTYYTPSPTDRQVDPLLCDPVAGDFELMVGSPCLPPGSIGCGLIGAFGEGTCGVVSVDPSSWGRVKSAYRVQEGDLR